MSSDGGDPYLDPASGVLRNLLGITDTGEPARAEAALSASRLIDLELRRLPGRYDLAHLQAFHRYILGDVCMDAIPANGVGYRQRVSTGPTGRRRGEIARRVLPADGRIQPPSGIMAVWQSIRTVGRGAAVQPHPRPGTPQDVAQVGGGSNSRDPGRDRGDGAATG